METDGSPVREQVPDTGNRWSIFLLLVPVAALMFAYFQKKHFIPPVNFGGFLLFSLKLSSVACLVLFALSFWHCRKNATLAMILLFLEFLWVVAGLALLVVVNAKYDQSEAKAFEKKVLQIHDGTPRRARLVRVESWGNPEEWLEVPGYKIAGAQPLKSVVRFTTRSGRLGFEYVTSIDVARMDSR